MKCEKCEKINDVINVKKPSRKTKDFVQYFR